VACSADLQDTLLLLNHSGAIDRSTSVIALTTVVAHRVLPLLAQHPSERGSRSPAYRAERRQRD